jgi:microcystin degradation protein MlrC
MSKRVLLAGLFHETHTFLEGVTGLDAFQVRRGDELLATSGDGSPLAGVVETAAKRGWELIPTIDLRATPSATVADTVFDLFWGEFSAAAERELAAGLDGIYLVLHGAMCTQSMADVEGEILGRIRRLTRGDGVPIGGVVDLHGNFSGAMAVNADVLVAYRENPHTDAHAAAVDAAQLLDRLMVTGDRPVTLWERPLVMWPPTGTATAHEPMRSLEAMARQVERDHADILVVNVLAGFSFADTPDTGVSLHAVSIGWRATRWTRRWPTSCPSWPAMPPGR